MNIATVGLDLAKNVMQVHAVNSQGEIVVRKQLRRAEVLRYFATLEPCVIGMEACASSHYWGRRTRNTEFRAGKKHGNVDCLRETANLISISRAGTQRFERQVVSKDDIVSKAS